MLQIFKINHNTYSRSTLKLPLDIIYKIFEYDPTFYIYKIENFKFELTNNIFEKMKSIIEERMLYDFYKNNFGIFIRNQDIFIQDNIISYDDFKIFSKNYNYYRLFSVIPINYNNNVTNYEAIIYKYKNRNKIPENFLDEYKYYYYCNPFIIFLEKIKKYIFLLEINDIENIQTFNFDIRIDSFYNFFNFNDFEKCINKCAKSFDNNEYIVQINNNYFLEDFDFLISEIEEIIPKKKQLLFEIEDHEFNIVKEFVDNYIEGGKDCLTNFNYFYYENDNFDFDYNIEYKLYFTQKKYYKKFAILPIDFNTNNVTKYDGIVFKYKNKDKISKDLFEYYDSSENYMEIFIKNAKKYFNNLTKNINFFPQCYLSGNLDDFNNKARVFSNDTNIIYIHYCKDPFTKI
jgi:hypothetical protein